jgi:hypothetical protein
MPANNSKTNHSIRRAAALERFKVYSGPKREGRTAEEQAKAAEGYLDRKEQERLALTSPLY